MPRHLFRLRLILPALLLLPLLSDCGDSSPIVIGFIGPLSGHSADLGLAGLNGVRLAVEAVNQHGGIDGHPIQLETQDDKQTVTGAIESFDHLAARHVQAIIGPMTSDSAVAVLPLANERHILLLSPTVTTRELAGIDDEFIRVIADTRQYARASALFHAQQRHLKNFAVLYDSNNRAYAESWANDFQDALIQQGGKVVLRIAFHSENSPEFAEMARRAVSSGTQAILVLGNAVDAALICQQIRQIDRRIPLVTSEWAATERFIALGGDAVEQVFTAQFVDRENTEPAYQSFRKLFNQRFQAEPGFGGITGYDAATTLISALRRRMTNESLRDAILRIADFDGLQGPLHIDRFGDSWRPTYITEIRQGRFIRAD